MFTAVPYNSSKFHENKTIFVTSGTPGSIQVSGVRFGNKLLCFPYKHWLYYKGD